MRKELKIQLFRSTVKGILLHGSARWTLTKIMGKDWFGIDKLYGLLDPISNVIKILYYFGAVTDQVQMS